MKYIFFLIIPLLVIPSLAYAEVGSNFDTVLNPNDSVTWTSHFERILNDEWNYVDYIFTDTAIYLQVETASASIQLDKITCEFSFYNAGIIGGKSPILIDDIIPYQSVDGSGVWNKINTLDDATCVTSWDGETLKASKNVVGLGNLEYSYKFIGTAWKTELKVTNLSGLNDRLFGFEETFDLNSDTINYGGSQRNLDTLDGSVFDRTFLETNEAKVIDLLNGINYDFDLGFDNLNQVSVQDTGVNSSLLTFQYFLNQSILLDGETLIIDPIFRGTTTLDARSDTNFAAGDNCPNNFDTTHADPSIRKPRSGSGFRCWTAGWQFDVTSLPDTLQLDKINFVQLEYGVTTVTDMNVLVPSEDYCVFVGSNATLPSSQHRIDGLYESSGSTPLFYAHQDSLCITTGSGKTVTLSTNASQGLLNDMASDETFTIVTFFENQTRRPNAHPDDMPQIDFTPNTARLIVVYNFIDAVIDLVALDVRGTAVDLSWSTPDANSTIIGYQINFTTPHSKNVASEATSDTGSTLTAYTVVDLSGLTNYSFRVKALPDGNFSGNVVNVTTLIDPTGSFTPGTFNITDIGSDIRDIRFDEITVSPTSTRVNVTFPDTFTNLKCDLSYQFALTNRTYENLASVPDPVVPGFNETTFLFNNVQNEIITIHCFNNSDGNGTYIITQASIPFVNQIKQFQAGEFGTSGDFGGLDLISLLVFGVIATIGFNRKNEAVGAVFLLFLTFGLSFFGIITIPTAMGGIIAVVILLVVVQVRKD